MTEPSARPATRRSRAAPPAASPGPASAPASPQAKVPPRPTLRAPGDLTLIPAAPEFRPTPEEWADPYKYLESIRAVGEQAGICKVIPPASWRPDFAVDVEHFKFHTRLQRLNSLEGQSRSQMNYMQGLISFWQNQGQPLTRHVMLDHKPVDFFALKKEVDRLGGPMLVTETQRWLEIGRFLGFSKKTCTSLSTSIRKLYYKYVLPYEVYLKNNPAAAAAAAAAGASPAAGSPAQTPSRMSGRMGGRAPTDVPVPPPAVTAPTTATAATAVATATTAAMAAAAAAAHSPSPVPLPGAGEVDVVAIMAKEVEEEACEFCHNTNLPERMLLCDGCDRGFHMDCLSPPLAVIPKSNWYCPSCLEKPDTDYGFEDGKLHTVSSFRKAADDFRRQYFAKTEEQRGGEPPAEDEIEREFWRLVEAVHENVEVEYGADVHTSKHGSAFPSVERHPTNYYATCPWNLNNLPVLSSSVFSHIRKSDISGMMVPWLYFGMVFSTFCWHNEDHYAYSINYMHQGDTKTWYGVPGSEAQGFERTMRETVPDLFEAQPDLLFQLVTMLDPRRLLENKVKVVKLHQHANEFVITFPQAYHAGFNQGFNVNEAVNFATLDWFEYGYQCMKRYREFRKAPCFSHDELIYNLLQNDRSIPTAIRMKDAVVRMHDEEVTMRERLRLKGVEWEEMSEAEMQDELSCSVCQTLCFLSVVHMADSKKALCLHDALDLVTNSADVDQTSLVVHLRFSRDHLRQFTEDVKKRANIPQDWLQRLRDLMRRYRRPPLQRLQTLYSEKKEKIPVPIPEADALATFIERASEWVDRAARVLSRKPKKRNLAAPEPKPKLAEVEQLCSEGDNLPFDVPEIQDLRLLAKSVHVFRDRARRVLAGDGPLSTANLDEVRAVLTQGLSLDVEVEELAQLQLHIDEAIWSDRVHRELADMGDFAVFETLLTMADQHGVAADHPLRLKLTEMQHRAAQWNEQVEMVLNPQRAAPRLVDMKVLLEDAKALMVSRALQARLQKQIAATDQWLTDCRTCVANVSDAVSKYVAAISSLSSATNAAATPSPRTAAVTVLKPPAAMDIDVWAASSSDVKATDATDVSAHATDATDATDATNATNAGMTANAPAPTADAAADSATAAAADAPAPMRDPPTAAAADPTTATEADPTTAQTADTGAPASPTAQQQRAAVVSPLNRPRHVLTAEAMSSSTRAAVAVATADEAFRAEMAEALAARAAPSVEDQIRATNNVLLGESASQHRSAAMLVMRLLAAEDPRLPFEQVRALSDSGRSIHVAVMHEVRPLKQMIEAAENWLVRGRNLFYRRGQVPSFEYGLRDLLEHTRAVLEPAQPGVDQAGFTIYCLCRQREAGMMVECERCKEWYHGKCVGLSKKMAATTKDYVCPLCDTNKPMPHTTLRPEIGSVVAWLRDSAKLSVLPRSELALAKAMVGTMLRWQEHAAQVAVTQPPDTRQVEQCLRQGMTLEVGTPEVLLLRRAKQMALLRDWAARAHEIIDDGGSGRLSIKEYRQILRDASVAGVHTCAETLQLRQQLQDLKLKKWLREVSQALVSIDAGPPLLEDLMRKGTNELRLSRLHPDMHRLQSRLDEFERAAEAAQAMIAGPQRVVNLSALGALAGVLPPDIAGTITNSPSSSTAAIATTSAASEGAGNWSPSASPPSLGAPLSPTSAAVRFADPDTLSAMLTSTKLPLPAIVINTASFTRRRSSSSSRKRWLEEEDEESAEAARRAQSGRKKKYSFKKDPIMAPFPPPPLSETASRRSKVTAATALATAYAAPSSGVSSVETSPSMPVVMTPMSGSATPSRDAPGAPDAARSSPNLHIRVPHSSSEVYCLCRAPAGDLPMLACDGCNEWFHLYCIKIDYECPSCAARNNRPYHYSRPAPGVQPPPHLLYYLSQGAASPTQSNAVVALPSAAPPASASSVDDGLVDMDGVAPARPE